MWYRLRLVEEMHIEKCNYGFDETRIRVYSNIDEYHFTRI